MNYLSKQAVRYSLCRMSKFHMELMDLFEYHGMDLLDNLGRRNILMSQAMEQFVAEEMGDDLGETVICDGHTGHADIVIPHLDKELECKLNSRYKGRSHSLQCDWETLGRKGSLDFLYFVTDAPFENFAALHFSDLTQDDFHPPSPGARNKSRMRLDRAMARCEVLHGDGLRINEIELDKILSEMNHRSEIHQVPAGLSPASPSWCSGRDEEEGESRGNDRPRDQPSQPDHGEAPRSGGILERG